MGFGRIGWWALRLPTTSPPSWVPLPGVHVRKMGTPHITPVPGGRGRLRLRSGLAPKWLAKTRVSRGQERLAKMKEGYVVLLAPGAVVSPKRVLFSSPLSMSKNPTAPTTSDFCSAVL
jgi:hypothetical protein